MEEQGDLTRLTVLLPPDAVVVEPLTVGVCPRASDAVSGKDEIHETQQPLSLVERSLVAGDIDTEKRRSRHLVMERLQSGDFVFAVEQHDRDLAYGFPVSCELGNR